ncbi:MAG TPA: hypothetical protein PLX50_07685 [Candidatus Aminicenantes bacterium]|nr:hypothetical protein [Acidobacteriota bacterium]HOI45477.1 hypothetical protein [Candidatus Aminicenantes bacterium]
METKRIIDLAIGVDWEYDRDFVAILEREARLHGLTSLVIWPENLSETLEKLRAGETAFRFYVDRASATSRAFAELQEFVIRSTADIIEPLEKVRWASDKATMHLEFIANGLETPFTVILPPFDDFRDLPLSEGELAPLGRPFVIKPANTTGGSVGVVDNAETVGDVLSARRHYPADKYLVQRKVHPFEADGKRFWFRGFYVLGLIRCAWWNDLTHVYAELHPEEVEAYALEPLFEIVQKIARVCRLRFFSTEIVRDGQGRHVVIDYVNEYCDMRLSSKHPDGVPDALVGQIASKIVAYARGSEAPGRIS